MIEVKGKYNSAIIYIDNVEDKVINQIKTLLDQEFVKGSKIRIMPDVHVGMGCTIGTTMTIEDKIVPNLVGVDIGCGLEVIKIKDKNIELQKLDKLIYNKIPGGFKIRDKEHKFNEEIDLNELRCRREVNLKRARLSIGTLGGGNHFIEANKDSRGNKYIVIHSGSRHLGHQVASLYQKKAYESLNKDTKKDIDEFVAELRSQGREKDIKRELKKRRARVATNIPRDLAYVSGQLFEDYIHDMKIVQYFAELNRRAMAEVIIRGMKFDVVEQFTTIHNYVDTENMILRKGAVSANQGEKLIIPINMRDGSLICIGKGNEDWNYSAPHGAGRVMSRTQAKKVLTLNEFKETMEGIYTTSVNRKTIDECAFAYKTMDEIIENVGDTVDIMDRIIPIYNFKAAD
ncbi:MAG: RtcB family protein [Natronincolaceae bacterium]|mgnify:CR=1 FL=1|jgi:tRNA-splicing ligase RtcB|nr:RtcB family protein [Bacillota bacterium]NLK90021.1 RtcB family protein [Clostridiales bacterium]